MLERFHAPGGELESDLGARIALTASLCDLPLNEGAANEVLTPEAIRQTALALRTEPLKLNHDESLLRLQERVINGK